MVGANIEGAAQEIAGAGGFLDAAAIAYINACVTLDPEWITWVISDLYRDTGLTPAEVAKRGHDQIKHDMECAVKRAIIIAAQEVLS